MKSKANWTRAFTTAMGNEEFKKIYETVKEGYGKGERTPCFFFAVDGIVYSFGFDGVDLHKGHFNEKRSAEMIANGTLIIK